MVQGAVDVFLKVSGTTTWPAAPEGSPALIVNWAVEHHVVPFVVDVVDDGAIVVGVAVVGVVDDVELQAAPRRARAAMARRGRGVMDSGYEPEGSLGRTPAVEPSLKQAKG